MASLRGGLDVIATKKKPTDYKPVGFFRLNLLRLARQGRSGFRLATAFISAVFHIGMTAFWQLLAAPFAVANGTDIGLVPVTIAVSGIFRVYPGGFFCADVAGSCYGFHV